MKKDMFAETTKCKKCDAQISVLAVFPMGLCVSCHAIKFDREVARRGGILPKPDFRNVINIITA